MEYTFKNSSNSSQWVTLYKGIEYTNPFSVKTLVYYMNIISQNTVFYYVLFVTGIIFSLYHWRKYGSLVLGFIVPYVVFSSAFLWKDDRFIVPIYPVVAVLSVIFLVGIKNRRNLLIMSLGIGILSIVSYAGCVWGLGPMGKRGLTDIVLPSFVPHPRRIYLTSMVWPPVKEYINADKIISLLRKNRVQKPAYISLLLVHEQLTSALSSYEFYFTHNEFVFHLHDSSQKNDLDSVLSDEFVLVRNPPVAVDGVVSICFRAFRMQFPHVYKFLGEVTIPSDGSVVSLYKREQGVTGFLPKQVVNECVQNTDF
jgi:hypothetical protein